MSPDAEPPPTSSIMMDRLNAALTDRYRVQRELGEGGMATVYLADDLRHDRKVALKVLKPELAAVVGADRFLDEIRTTANLQHPHILPLFDSGEADGFLFYVMPYVDGESLRERLDREHQLPVDEAVRYAGDIAEALEYAHGRGVIHRDIKPANILLQAGRPMVTDFGIALAVRAGGAHRLTETGLSLGTPHYMSPEQATGDQHVGPATDTYALGCVLYEMLVGEPPFTGSTPQAILGKIIAGAPESIRAQRRSVPENVEAAVAAALERVAADRFTSAGDFARALADPGFRHRAVAGSAERGPHTPDRRVWAATAAAVVFAILAAWGWLGPAPSDGTPARVSRTTISLDGDHRLALAWSDALPVAISRDGSVVAYVGESATGTRLYARRLDSFDPVPLSGTEGARQPFFSPDGREIAYFNRRFLMRVQVSGGDPIRVAELPQRAAAEVPILPAGGAWGAGGVIVFASADSVLWRVSVAGGRPPEALHITFPDGDDALAGDDRGDPAAALGLLAGGARWPYFLPASGDPETGGQRVLLKLGQELAVVSLADGTARLLGVQMFGQGIYVPTGHIIATEGAGQVRAVPFHLPTLSVTGAPFSLLEDVFRPSFTPGTVLAISSETGTLVYVPGGAERTVWLVDRAGRGRRLTQLEPRDYRLPSFSPDGSRLAIDPRSGGIVILDLTTGGSTTHPGTGAGARWSPDGLEFAFGSPPRRASSVPGPASRPIPEAPDSTYLMDWGRDGRLLLTMPYERAPNGAGILIASMGSGAPAEVVIDTEYNETLPMRSPDGRWLTYVSDVSGRPEVYMRALDAPDAQATPVSIDGGNQPLWSRSGDEIFYWKAEQLFSVRLLSTDPLELSPPEPLFTGRYFLQGGQSWDVSPTGEFVLISARPNWLREILVVQNFFEELEQRGPN